MSRDRTTALQPGNRVRLRQEREREREKEKGGREGGREEGKEGRKENGMGKKGKNRQVGLH